MHQILLWWCRPFSFGSISPVNTISAGEEELSASEKNVSLSCVNLAGPIIWCIGDRSPSTCTTAEEEEEEEKRREEIKRLVVVAASPGTAMLVFLCFHTVSRDSLPSSFDALLASSCPSQDKLLSYFRCKKSYSESSHPSRDLELGDDKLNFIFFTQIQNYLLIILISFVISTLVE